MFKKIFAMALFMALVLPLAQALAVPSVKIGSTTIIKESIDAAIEQKLKEAQDLKKFVLEDATNEDLAKLCALFPKMESLLLDRAKRITDLAPLATTTGLRALTIRGSEATDLSALANLTELTSLSVSAAMEDLSWLSQLKQLKSLSLDSKKLTSLQGLPQLPNMRSIVISHAVPHDLTPLATQLPALRSLQLTYVTMPDDLTPLAMLQQLESLDLYGAHIKDFSALANCPKLKTLTYYATKGADYATLGTLTQVHELKGGLTALNDIGWIAQLPNLKRFTLFAENVRDYTPLAKTNLEYLKIWSMRQPVDLVPVGKIATLKELILWSLEKASGSQALNGLTSLEKLTVADFNKQKGGENFALSAAANWKHLTHIELRGTMVDDFATLAQCTELTSVHLGKNVQGIADLGPLKALPKLKRLRLPKAVFSENELQGFGASVKIVQ